MPIRIFKILPMPYTPFVYEPDLDFLKSKGIVMTEDLGLADIILASTSKIFRPLVMGFRNRKKYVVWTNEPRYDINFKRRIPGFFIIGDIHIINVYTGDIFVNNYSLPFIDDFYKEYWTKPLNYLGKDNFQGLQNRKVAMIAICRNNQPENSFKQDGIELDLNYLRSHIALEGYKLGKVDIYGRDWPQGASLGESRDGNYISSKLEILDNYNFNLCFENTNFDYYCTEKIWDSIRSYCLPIYYGRGNKIYEDFPRKSFLDFCDFGKPKDLFDYIDNMSEAEFLERMNLCIQTYNNVCKKLESVNRYEQFLLRTVHRIEAIMQSGK